MKKLLLFLFLLSAVAIAGDRAAIGDGNFSNTSALSKERVAVCGNGVKENGEDCDGTDLSIFTCENTGNRGGTLTCDGSCNLVTTACCGDPPTANLVSWWDSYDIDGDETWNSAYSDGQSLSGGWEDKGTINLELAVSNASFRPVVSTSCINGLPCIVFDGVNDYLEGASVSAWNLLHDGSDFTAYTVWKTVETNPDSLICLWTTQGSPGSGARGATHFFDDRSGVPRNNRELFFSHSGTLNIFNNVSADNVSSAGQWHISVSKTDDDAGAGADNFVYVDGTLVASEIRVNAYSASNATRNLTLAYPAGCALETTYYSQILIYSAAHDNTARTEVEDWLECAYGAFPQ